MSDLLAQARKDAEARAEAEAEAEISVAKPDPRKGTRRRRGEVPRLIMDAARELFARKGYRGASTREIAELAGVSEPLIFSHYGSKAELFNRAVLGPFDEFIDDFVARWNSELQYLSNEDLAREYYTRLYDMLTTHKELLRALISVSAYDEGLDGDASETHMSRQLGRLDALMISQEQRDRRGITGDVVFSSRIGFAAVVATAVLEDWLFPKGEQHPSRSELIEHLSAFAIQSTRTQASTPRPSPPKATPKRTLKQA